MQPKGFVDDSFEIRQPLDDFRRCNRVVLVSESLVKFGLKFGLGFGVQCEVVSDSAGGARISLRLIVRVRGSRLEISLGGGIGASNELGEGLSSEFRASHRLPFVILAFLEFAQKIHAVRRGLETLGDRSNSNSSQIRSRNAPLAIPRVEFLQKRSNPRRENTHRGRIVSSFVQDLDGGEVSDIDFRFLVSVGGHCVGLGFDYGGHVLCCLDHTEGGSEREVTDDIEREVVIP